MAVLNNTGIRAGASAAGGGGGDLTIEKSLIFSQYEDTYMTRTPSGAGNRKTFTWSFWYKKSRSTSWTHIIGVDSSSAERQHIRWLDKDQIEVYFISSSNQQLVLTPTRKFEDEHAWMHMVLAVDTNQATASDRAKFYINGVQETVFGQATYPSRYDDTQVNNTIQHIIGKRGYDGNSKLNAKLAEVHQIDGLALEPTSFGKFDATTGVWVPIEYTGGHGTNGYHLDFKDDSTITALGYDVSGNNNHFTPYNFQVPNANAPTASGGGNGSDGIQNGWCSGGNFSNNDANNTGAYYTGDLEFIGLEADSGDTFGMFGGTTDSSSDTITISKKINDAGNWIDIGSFTLGSDINSYWPDAVDGGLHEGTLSAGFTANDRVKMHGGNNFLGILRVTKNGAKVGPLRNNVERSATNDTPTNSEPEGGDTCLGGELTGNFCQWTYTYTDKVSFTGQDLTKAGSVVIGNTGSNNQSSLCGNMGVTSGKWYCEYWIKNHNLKNLNATGQSIIQVGPMYIDNMPWYDGLYSSSTDKGAVSGDPLPGSVTATYGSCGWRMNGNAAIGNWPGSAWTAASTPTFTGGDIIGMALDMDNGAVYFRKNGTWLASADPTSGASKTGAMHTWTPHPHVPLTPAVYCQNLDEIYLNTGAVPFANQGPSGYKTWCSQNLPDFSSGGTLNQPNKFFNITQHSGTGGTSSIDVGFEPGMGIWWAENVVSTKYLFDQIRGDGHAFKTNNTDASVSTSKQSFETNGIEVVDDGTYELNKTGQNYRGYFWNLSSSTPSTAGALNATDSWFNDTTGMEILKRTGDGNTRTIGHQLGAEPTFIWDKKNASGTNDHWYVYNKYYGGGKHGRLDRTDKFKDTENTNQPWADTDATSTVFTVGGNQNLNGSTYHTVLFTEKPGFSRFGVLRGKEDVNPLNYAYTGFRPAFVMIFNASGGASGYDDSTREHKQWYMWDIKDNPVRNWRSTLGHMNNTYAQTYDIYHSIVMNSNGFAFATVNAQLNQNNEKHVWAAFAEHPWKIARAA